MLGDEYKKVNSPSIEGPGSSAATITELAKAESPQAAINYFNIYLEQYLALKSHDFARATRALCSRESRIIEQ